MPDIADPGSFTGLVDLDGTGGLFAQVNGRASAAVVAWFQAQDPEWRARITHVSMDTSATYARAALLALPALVLALWSSRSSIAGISMPGHPFHSATATRHT